MNPFRKRSKSDAAKKRRGGTNGLSGQPQIIPSIDVAFSLPSEKAFRTSLLMPKMADRFSLLRMDDSPSINAPYSTAPISYAPPPTVPTNTSGNIPNGQIVNGHFAGAHLNGHTRDLSILEEYDEEEEDLPVQPWKNDTKISRSAEDLRGLSKADFIKVRAQEGNNLFGGRQRMFKIKSEDGEGSPLHAAGLT
jgi:hypothetical protein